MDKKTGNAGKTGKIGKMDKVQKYSEERPWGGFDEFCKNAQCTVKILYLKPNEALSLQYHYKRNEFWKVIKGEATVILGEKQIKAKAGDEFFIPMEEKHRIVAGSSPVEVLEISFGYFDEKDEVRLEDKYKRVVGTII